MRCPATPRRLLAALALAHAVTACASAQTVLDFKALGGREIVGPNGLSQARWTDSETGARIFNLALTSDGARRGPNNLPGEATLTLPAAAPKLKISLKFVPGSNGVAAMTLISSDGNKRLRFHHQRGEMIIAWRDRTDSEEAIQFRRLKTLPAEGPKTLELTVDVAGNQIGLSDGETTDTVKGKENGAPDIVVPELEKVIASVEGDTTLEELKIEEL